MNGPILRAVGLTRAFGGIKAVTNASIAVRSGSISGILGPNGAGKTTFFNLLTGFTKIGSGEVYLRDERVTNLPPHILARRGLVRTFQLAKPLAGLTVEETVLLPALRVGSGQDRRDARERAAFLLEQVGLHAKAAAPAEALTYGDLRRLEIARALMLRPKLLLLDEPFAGLGPGEIETVSQLILDIRSREDVTVLIIEHKLREFFKLVETVVVMVAGEVVVEGEPAEIVQHPKVLSAYLGERAYEH